MKRAITPTRGLAKHRQVREAIMEAIRSGEFKPDERLPAERDLADRFGVSYMTARRAVVEMVESNLLERRAREGTYVRLGSPKKLSTTTVALICSDSDTSGLRAFRRLGARAVEARGWRPQTIRLHRDYLRPAVRVLEDGGSALVLVEGPELESGLGDAMRGAKGRAILIGNRLDGVGVPSVLADDAQAIRLAVETLKSAGHQKIALVTDHPIHPIDRVQIAAWKACFADAADTLNDRLIVVNTPRLECQTEYAYEAARRYLSGHPDVTALICLSDEMTLGTLAACRDEGRPVPETMSLVSSGDSALMAFAHPPVTCINVHMEEHIAQAMQLLEAALEDRLDPSDRLRLVQPHLVERQSVAPPSA